MKKELRCGICPKNPTLHYCELLNKDLENGFAMRSHGGYVGGKPSRCGFKPESEE